MVDLETAVLIGEPELSILSLEEKSNLAKHSYPPGQLVGSELVSTIAYIDASLEALCAGFNRLTSFRTLDGKSRDFLLSLCDQIEVSRQRLQSSLQFDAQIGHLMTSLRGCADPEAGRCSTMPMLENELKALFDERMNDGQIGTRLNSSDFFDTGYNFAPVDPGIKFRLLSHRSSAFEPSIEATRFDAALNEIFCATKVDEYLTKLEIYGRECFNAGRQKAGT
jgi:hypothetical protein